MQKSQYQIPAIIIVEYLYKMEFFFRARHLLPSYLHISINADLFETDKFYPVDGSHM